jgi:hypothetical protein
LYNHHDPAQLFSRVLMAYCSILHAALGRRQKEGGVGSGAVYWASNTAGKLVANASVTDTCALVLYSRDDGSVIWSSGTSCKSPPPPPPPPPSPAPPLPPPTPVDCTTIRDKVVAGYQVRAHRSASGIGAYSCETRVCISPAVVCCWCVTASHCNLVPRVDTLRHRIPPNPLFLRVGSALQMVRFLAMDGGIGL